MNCQYDEFRALFKEKWLQKHKISQNWKQNFVNGQNLLVFADSGF